MRVVIVPTATDVARFSARHIQQTINRKKDAVLGLATGSSPIALYKELIAKVKAGACSFRNVTTYNLDEYLGLSGDHPQSYRYFMNEHLFKHIDIDRNQTHVPNGDSHNPIQACQDYETQITASGGIDLQLLGIGQNGHIGFNEPSSSLTSRTRVKTLTQDTISANQRFFSEDEFQPYLAITMGIGTIMESREIILIATGENKAAAIKHTVEGPISASCPASILQMHAKALVVVDEAAASQLDNIEFYQYIEQEQQRLLAATGQL